MSYLKRSFKKFREDALSKFFYDLLKALAVSIVGVLAVALIPQSTSFGEILRTQHSLSLYSLILSSLIIITITIFTVTLLFDKKYKRLKAESQTDETTGLKNHKAFTEYLNETITSADTSAKTFSLILLDVDDFKKFNTKYSTTIADQVLSKLGELLANDRRSTDETFRQFLRGDEFVIVTKETSLDDAMKAAERKRNLIGSTAFIVDKITYKLTVSCGVTAFKQKKDSATSLIDRAHRALIEAKGIEGKNNTKSSI